MHSRAQTAIAVGTLIVAAVMGFGASGIRSDAGYAGIGPNFVPWFVCIALAICGLLLLTHSLRGGFRNLPEPSGGAQADWVSFAWVSAGLLLNAALIERIGFVLSCALCFVFAVRGLRRAEGKPNSGIPQMLQDVCLGLLISAPVFWLFTKALKINLPGLTGTGWF